MNTSRPNSQGLPAQQGHVNPAAQHGMPQGGRQEVSHVHHPHAPSGPIQFQPTDSQRPKQSMKSGLSPVATPFTSNQEGMSQGQRMPNLSHVDPQRAQQLYQHNIMQQQQQKLQQHTQHQQQPQGMVHRMPNPRQPFQPPNQFYPPVSQVSGIRPIHPGQARVSAAPNAYVGSSTPTFQPRYQQPGHPGQPGYPANMAQFAQQGNFSQYAGIQHYQQSQAQQFQPGAHQFQPGSHVPNPNAPQYMPQQPPTTAAAISKQKPSKAILIKDPSTGKAVNMNDEKPKTETSSQPKSRNAASESSTGSRSRQQSESQKTESQAPAQIKVEKPQDTTTASQVKIQAPTPAAGARNPSISESANEETPLKPVDDPTVDDGSWATVKDNKKDKRKNVNRKDSESRAATHNQESRDSKNNAPHGNKQGNKNAKSDVGSKRRPSKEETKNVNSDPVKVEPVAVKEAEKPKEEPVAEATPEPVATEPATTPVETAAEEPTEETTNPEPTVNAPTPTEATPEPTEEKPAEKTVEETPATPAENGAQSEKVAETAAAENAAKAAAPAAVVEFGTLAAENRTKLENGEKVAYERDFLLKFQGLCLNKPIELPTLDVILDGPTDGHRKPPKHESVGRGSWTPGYLPKGNNRKGSRNHPNKNTSVIKIPTKKPQLHVTENAYKRGVAENLEETEKKTVQLVRSAKSILNKITPEKEAKLTKEFIQNIKPDTYDRLEKVVAAVFSKAIEEQHFAKIYAKLCKNCHENWDKDDKIAFFRKEDGSYESITRREARDRKIKPKGFREVLLSKAQEQFNKLKILNSKDKENFAEGSLERRRLEVEEKINALPAPEDKEFNKRTKMELDEEYEELNTRIKIRGLGNVKFVGELYMEGLLSLNIIKICCQQLVYSDSENELESLCKLIPTIGKRMQTGPQVPNRAQQAQFAQAEQDKKKGAEILTIVFGKIEKIVSEGKTLGATPSKVSPRVICLLQDVIDIRSRNWEMRTTAMKGPSKIGDLHDNDRKKAEEDAKRVEREFMKAQYERSQLNNERRQRINQGDWVKQSHVTKSKFDASKLASTASSSMDARSAGSGNITLGPRRRGGGFKNASMDKGSNENSANSSGRNTPISTPRNPFDLLDSDAEMPERLPPAGGKRSSRDLTARKGSLAANNGPRGGGRPNFKNSTHDGRYVKKSLTPEEIQKKAGTLYSDLEECQGDLKMIVDVGKDNVDLFETVDHQIIILDVLLEKVIEKSVGDREALSKLLMVIADEAKFMDWEACIVPFVKKAVEEDRVTDCPKFWQYLSQCICKIYTSPAVDPKSIKGITEPAKDLCAWTNAICALIEEIDYSLRNKEKIHDLYTNAEIDLAAIIAEDGLSQTPEERLGRRGLDFLLKPLVVVPWGKVESQLIGSLEDHTFGEAEMEDFSKEFDMLEEMVPEGPDGRGHRNFIKVLVNGVMTFSVDSDTNQLIVRSHEGDVRDTNFSDCEVLLRKYIDNEDDRIETLFVLSDIFRKKHENNATLIKEVFSELYELSIMEIPTFQRWIKLRSAEKLENFAVISAATKSFYDALEEEVKLNNEKSKSPTQA
ncbi:Oidioi.mRNA.OKI2018_I69.chr1.g2544.t3.cds [Oikopleura dioica]|uniref:Oidioi.mRNA.OKI2018_I69.chr1.g2544.t3.cds n=1 Tax=Oikopleura dioica TaxID=34765 RepID=A0ABN7SUX6_OIKDI|nr:Oidioi.mRNA.OKI2018_I69.chr1.g2544.t3.cds [Oikopleura dioica]